MKEELRKIPANFHEFRRIQKRTMDVGSDVEMTYHPDEMLDNPPEDVTLEMLMAAQTHIGHNTSLWKPANARYIEGARAGVHIISLETTASHLRRAARVVEEVAYRGGTILFVGTRRGQMPIVVRSAEIAGACHLFQKWMPGTITNRDVMLRAGRLRMVDLNDNDVPAFDEHLQICRPVQPDLVICLNPLENYPMLAECGLALVPTIGIIDTDADPTWVTYQIPANDDSLRSVTLISAALAAAGRRGQGRRRAAAQDGIITWETPKEQANYMKRQEQLRKKEEKARGIAGSEGQEAEDDAFLEHLSQAAMRKTRDS